MGCCMQPVQEVVTDLHRPSKQRGYRAVREGARVPLQADGRSGGVRHDAGAMSWPRPPKRGARGGGHENQ